MKQTCMLRRIGFTALLLMFLLSLTACGDTAGSTTVSDVSDPAATEAASPTEQEAPVEPVDFTGDVEVRVPFVDDIVTFSADSFAAAFPGACYVDILNNGSFNNETILGYVMQAPHLASMDATGEDRWLSGSYTEDEFYSRSLVVVFDGAYHVCGFFAGQPELDGGDVVLHMQRVDLDVTEACRERRAQYDAFMAELPYIAPEEVSSCGATRILCGYRAHPEKENMENGKDEEMYLLWVWQTADNISGHGWSDYRDLGQLSQGSGWWRYYLLLDDSGEVVGYTLSN